MNKKKIITLFFASLFLLVGQSMAGEALFGEWLFNDATGTVAHDSSGFGNNANLTGTAVWGGDYFHFTGSNYFKVSHQPSSFKIDMSKSFMISLEINTLQTSTGVIFSRHNGSWVPGAKEIYIASGYPAFSCGFVGSLSGTTFVADGYWHEIELLYDADTGVIELWVDGYFDATSNMPTLKDFGDNFDIYMGVEAAWAYYQGDIKNVRIYQFPTMAYNPNPANADAGVSASTSSVLWQTPDENYTYDVYLSTVREDVNSNAVSAKIGSNQSALSCPVTLGIGQTYYWKVNCIEPNSHVIAGDIWSFSTISYKAYNPNPGNESTDASIFKQLGWSAGLSATNHRVYISDSFSAVNNDTVAPITVTSTNCNPGTLKLDTTYYWRVDEVAGSTTTRGDIWSFTTNALEIIDNFQYFTDAELQTAWSGPATNVMSAWYNHNWMKVPYSTTDQIFTRTFTNTVDLSKCPILTMDYRHDVAAGESGAALVTVSLYNTSNTLLLTSQMTEPIVNWPTTDFGIYVAKWNVPIWADRANLTAIKKISIKVAGVASPGANDAFFVDNLAISGPACENPISGDLNGNCQVDFSDFAAFAEGWMTCNRIPADTCFSY